MTDEKKTAETTAALTATVADAADENNDAADNPDIVTVKLKKAFRGKNEITLDFGSLTGATLIRCEKNAKTIDNMLVVASGSLVYNAQVAAAAAKVRYDDIINLSAQDFAAVARRVGSFLSGLE